MGIRSFGLVVSFLLGLRKASRNMELVATIPISLSINMEPVRIRYFGIFPITKRQYIIAQSIIFVISICLIVYCWTLPKTPRFGFDLNNPRLPKSSHWILSHALELVLFATFLEILDAIFALRAFAKKEREQKRTHLK